jgi:dipeptidase E
MRILLISNSTLYGSGYLDHAADEIRDFLSNLKRVVFVPFALHDRDAYAAQAKARFEKLGYKIESLHQSTNPKQSIENAEAIFIGGGNTFRLLNSLYDLDLLDVIRQRVIEGVPYIGSSAGSNVAGPTIKTTNDMPIIEPPSFVALNLVQFQINPHFLDPDPNSTHMGETREQRLLQFLEENDTTVVALREGAMIRIENGTATLKGTSGGRVFRKDHEPNEITPGTILDDSVLG